jgi:hypothetical protein
LNDTQQLAAFLQPDHGAGGDFQIANAAVGFNEDRGCSLDEDQGFLLAIAVIYLMLRIRLTFHSGYAIK